MEHLEKTDEANYSGLTKRDDLIIHSIPKRFINSKQSQDVHHRGMGILILGLGFIIMAAGAALIYFFVFNQAPKTAVSPEAKEAEKSEPISPNNQDAAGLAKDETIDKEPKDIDKPIGQAAATSSDTAVNLDDSKDSETETATSTEVKTIVVDPITEPVQPVITQPVDSDNDGLFDQEESILGTNLNLPDSDGDTYPDQSELLNMFNPAGQGKIEVNPKIEKYINSVHKYSFLYPMIWVIENANANEAVVVKIDNNQFFQIIIADNLANQTLEEWYAQAMGASAVPPAQNFYKNNWYGILSQDGSTAYLNRPGSTVVFALTYSVTTGTARSYQNIVDLMIKSFELTD